MLVLAVQTESVRQHPGVGANAKAEVARGVGWVLMATAILVLVGASSAWADRELHVAPSGDDRNPGNLELPLASLTEAKRRVRDWIANGLDEDARVVIHAGSYTLSEPLVFDSRDSAPVGRTITYAAADPGHVQISGGRRVEGWQRDAPGRWSAPCDLPEPLGGGQGSENISSADLPRQLFIGDRRLIRARQPNQGYFRIVAAGADQRTGFQWDPADWVPPENLDGIELVYLHDWSVSRVRLASVDQATHVVSLKDRIGAAQDFFRIGGFEPHPRYFLENSLDWLDVDDEFVMVPTSGKLHLQLPSDQSPEESAVIVPWLTHLMRIEGTAHEPVRGLCFTGLDFRHTSCSIPPGGYAGIQASYFERRSTGDDAHRPPDPVTESGHPRPIAACQITYANDCRFDHCQFQQLGGGGIYLDRQTRDIAIDRCVFDDIGGCGIMIGETITRAAADSGMNDIVQRNRVQDCRISRCGQIFLGSIGIWIGIAQETTITRCEISKLPYTGISVGWRWDDQPTGCHDNTVAENRIHHVMQELSDGGGIYTLGLQPGTVLANNQIHDIPVNAGRAESNGIFMDEGSSQILVSGNTIFRTARSPIRFHRAGVNALRENLLFMDEGVEPFTYNSTDPAVMVLENNQLQNNAQFPRDDDPDGSKEH